MKLTCHAQKCRHTSFIHIQCLGQNTTGMNLFGSANVGILWNSMGFYGAPCPGLMLFHLCARYLSTIAMSVKNVWDKIGKPSSSLALRYHCIASWGRSWPNMLQTCRSWRVAAWGHVAWIDWLLVDGIKNKMTQRMLLATTEPSSMTLTFLAIQCTWCIPLHPTHLHNAYI